ncbi:penicillin-binding protein activator [Pokkaliibacter sp. CJK22405]|uniref:penicillin-binding protein activator n=1 Tax=Pokkaliibacter sp. CJK22405 TaxID=3384615 RepID=UPI003984DF60
MSASILTKRLALSLAITASITLSGCVTTTSNTNNQQRQRTASQQPIQSIITRSSSMAGTDRSEYLLLQAEQLMDQDRPGDAKALTDMIHQGELSADLKLEYAFLRARLELERHDGNQALFWLHDPVFKRIQLTDVDLQTLYQLRAQAFEMTSDYLDAAKERIALSDLLSGDQRQTQNDLLWRDLQKSSTTALTQARQNAADQLTQGWLALALSLRSQPDLMRQTMAYNQWKQQWPDHPAAQTPPGEVIAVADTNTEAPNKIALLLPMSGQLSYVSKAIQQGFMTSYYARQKGGLDAPEVLVRNTEEYPNLLALYQDLKQQGVDFVVGPLRKTQLDQLSGQSTLPIDTLALNVLDDSANVPTNMTEYGLTIEDEARQLAHQAWQDGKHSAMILSEPGDWAQRGVNAFREEFTRLGGQIADQYSVGDQNSYVDASTQWLHMNMTAAQAKRRNGKARHRDDIDMIVLISQPMTARQVMPALAFNYASDLPVYATSQVYSGSPDPQHDQDLNGLYFTIMPLLLKGHDESSPDVQQYWDSASSNTLNFFAMGMDAFELMLRVPLMKEHTSARFYGQTGILSLDGNEVHRELSIARIRSGAPYPIITNQPQD